MACGTSSAYGKSVGCSQGPSAWIWATGGTAGGNSWGPLTCSTAAGPLSKLPQNDGNGAAEGSPTATARMDTTVSLGDGATAVATPLGSGLRTPTPRGSGSRYGRCRGPLREFITTM